ncbi:MAG: hypothetical protein LBV18_02210 [Alistipes sp.]|jgi:hypothetical protein|nr:hypothetical protein [Alistipes sp.]
MVKKVLLSIIFLVCACRLVASSEPTPDSIVAYSENREYRLTIYPRKMHQIEWRSSKEKRRFFRGLDTLPNETVLRILDSIYYIPCHAVLCEISASDTLEIWNKPLVNYSSPVNAIVSDDGKYVATTGDFLGGNYRHALVVYGEGGEVMVDYHIEDISPFPMEQYAYSSIGVHWITRWGDVIRFLDNGSIEVSFQNEAGEERTREFDIGMLRAAVR